jgi:hypothetical protein
MKKVIIISLIAIACISMASCKKNTDGSSLKPGYYIAVKGDVVDEYQKIQTDESVEIAGRDNDDDMHEALGWIYKHRRVDSFRLTGLEDLSIDHITMAISRPGISVKDSSTTDVDVTNFLLRETKTTTYFYTRYNPTVKTIDSWEDAQHPDVIIEYKWMRFTLLMLALFITAACTVMNNYPQQLFSFKQYVLTVSIVYAVSLFVFYGLNYDTLLFNYKLSSLYQLGLMYVMAVILPFILMYVLSFIELFTRKLHSPKAFV